MGLASDSTVISQPPAPAPPSSDPSVLPAPCDGCPTAGELSKVQQLKPVSIAPPAPKKSFWSEVLDIVQTGIDIVELTTIFQLLILKMIVYEIESFYFQQPRR